MRMRFYVGLTLLLILLLLPKATLAHTGHGGIAAREEVQVGPYMAVVEFSEYPPVAERSLQIVVVPEGGIEGVRGQLRFTSARGNSHRPEITYYPGINDALTLNHPGLPHDGTWQIELYLSGPKGSGAANLAPIDVAPPPNFPKWLGWLMAATPILIYFGYLGWAYGQLRQAPAANEEARPAATGARNRTAVGLLVGAILYVLGVLWDIQWHRDVGPDTFFTAPHTLLYGGMTIAGIVALVAVVRRQATHGVWMAGLGALCFLLGGLFDLWWHTLYGFDVTLASPPHVMLLLSGFIELTGLLFHLSTEIPRIRRVEVQQHPLRFAEVAFVAALGSLFVIAGSFILLLFLTTRPVAGPVATAPIVQALFVAAFMAVAVGVLRRPGAATALALVILLWKSVLALLIPLLVRWLSNYLALGYQADAFYDSVGALALSTYILPLGLLVDGALWVGQRRRLRLPVAVALVLGVGALLLYLIDPFSARFQRGPADVAHYERVYRQTKVMTPLVVPLVGLLSALAGWRFAQILRYQRR